VEATTECPLTIEWDDLEEARRPRVVTAYSLDSAFLTSTDEWSVTVYDTDPERLRWLALAPLRLLIHGKHQLCGRVEHVARGRNGNEVTITGRDHLAALVETNIDPTVRVTEDMTLAAAILAAAGPCGITEVWDETGGQLSSLKSGAPPSNGIARGFPDLQPGNLKPEPGMGIYEWLNRIAARQGCTLQPGPTRESIYLSEPHYDQPPIATFRRSRDPAESRRNNVVEATSDENYSTFPTCGLATGKIAATGKKAEAAGKTYDVKKVIEEAAPALAAKIGARIISTRVLPTAAAPDPLLLYRFLYLKDEESRKPEQVERAITRAVSERLRETLTYRATVRGHIDPDSGYVFATDSIATVRDEVCDLDERLWIAERSFSYQRGQGARSTLTMWRPGSLVL
jgi:prophage tail gpP-like protein